ncbi:MAG TPA: helix-turn-helix transcriptional regulator [Solirubrobacteraceae bacterium]|jgi:DNA-binding PadR family transcriptional regulator|nr:helix-turn-helix transcriptional regulator [Solirubrobacteraceae bacterium]
MTERHDAAPMRSPVNWALLGLIIERPSYAYNLAQRFERRYGAVLPLSNVGHVYTALKALGDRSLVEEIAGSREGRQPRPRYQATVLGTQEYREWLVGRVGEDRRRQQMFVLALAALANEPQDLLEVIERCEQAWLQEGMHTPIAREQDTPADGVTALLDRLIGEENRLAVGASLAWIEYARQELKKFRGWVRGA